MARPTRRSGSTFIQFKKRIPLDLRTKAVGKTFATPVGDGIASALIGPHTETVQLSLRTRDPIDAAARQAVALTHWFRFLDALRNGPKRLTQREIVALSGEAYRDFVDAFEDDPGVADRWQWVRGWVLHTWPLYAPREDDAEPSIPHVDRVLATHGLVVDHDSRKRMHEELGRVLLEAAERLTANAEGDYRPDTNVERFPVFTPHRSAVGVAPRVGETITGVLEGWWTESKATGTAASTYINYGGAIRKLVAFLGHDDASRVTPADIVRFKDYRLAQGLSPRTVKDADLPALKSIFGWAKVNLRMAINPAEGITLRRIRTTSIRNKWFSPEEVKAILRAATDVQRANESEKAWLAKRWVPWVLAYTGARIGEIVQLRRADLHRADDHWELEITPGAGAVKNGMFRRVPLHPHLVEMGFVDMVHAAPAGHLFVQPNKDTGDTAGPSHGVENRVREFVRQHLTAKGVGPNHGWRHLFIHNARMVGMDVELRSMIVGQAGQTVAAREYGGPAGLYREICKQIRFEV